jgi:FkbM family methyltransferase
MIEKIHGHSIDIDLLTSDGFVLDIGCNDFIFSRNMINKGMKVIGLDPLEGIYVPQDLLNSNRFVYLNHACVGIKDKEVKTYYAYLHTGANSLYNTPENLHNPIHGGHAKNPFLKEYSVNVTTISEIMVKFNVNQFDLIKMDVEGAEYDILENLPLKCSKQISIEFHDFLHLNPMSDVEEYHRRLQSKLSDYKVIVEEEQRGDSLYVLIDCL